MASKKIKKTDLGVTLLIIIGILVVVNFLSYQIFARWDLTQNKVYSISRASKKTVSGLDDIVNIKAYFSSTLPSQVFTLKQEVADLLEEYQTYSNGKIRVEFIDPGDDKDLQRKLSMIGIPQLTFEVYEKDKTQLVNGYMGIAISFGDNTEVIPAIKRNTSDLEYQITKAIKKVASDKISTIGILTSQGTLSLENGMSTAYKELQSLYTVREVSLTDDNPEIPSNISTLIIVGPKEKFSEEQLKAINAYFSRGGALLVFLDGVKIGQGLRASKNITGLDKLLADYGVTINQNLVADKRNGIASFSQGFFTFSSNYAFWPKITNEGFNKDNNAVSNLENVIFPWASSISVDNSKISDGEITDLAFTTNQAWAVKDNFDVTPNSANTPQGEQKQYNLAVLIKGNFANPYQNEDSQEDRPFSNRIIVVGDSDFITDNFIKNSPDNLRFFQNLVDSLSLDDDLINIRSKTVSSRPIKVDLSDSAKAAIRYLNVFGLTILIVLYGLVRYFMRRKSRFVDEL